METYNPLSEGRTKSFVDYYWSYQDWCDTAMFMVVFALVVALLVAVA